MNNLSSYFVLVDAKIRASDKDLPVLTLHNYALKRKSFVAISRYLYRDKTLQLSSRVKLWQMSCTFLSFSATYMQVTNSYSCPEIKDATTSAAMQCNSNKDWA